MATIASQSSQPSTMDASVKALAESSALKHVPSEYTFINDPTALESASIPTIDFSLLTSTNPHQRSKAVDDIGKACEEWGFFILVNHDMPEELMKKMFDATMEFFSLPEDEKQKYKAKNVSDPINCGNLNIKDASNQTFALWRDYLKANVHPEFHCPLRPQILRDALSEYSERARTLVRTLLDAISEFLELRLGYMEEELKLDSMNQLFNVNLYPPCPNPDKAMGLPPHTDHGLFSILIHNGVPGLQVEHKGEWFNVNSPQNAILVNTGDQLEIFSNGQCKAVRHRAVVNTKTTRMSIVIANGPSPDAIVSPASQLVQKDGRALYRPMKYAEYIETILTSKKKINAKTLLEQLKFPEI